MGSQCPVCRTEIISPMDQRVVSDGIERQYACRRCGGFSLRDDFGAGALESVLRDDSQKIAVLSHWIRTTYESIRERRENHTVFLTEDVVSNVVRNPRASVAEQADKLVLWLGDQVKLFNEYADVDKFAVPAIVGSASFDEFVFVFSHLRDQGVVQHKGGSGDVWAKARLSFPGWDRYHALKRATDDSRKAFMAMEYGHDDLDKMYKEYFKPTVQETGFDLFILPERPKAGLIDDKLRVEIRTSRFLVADLTHENAGAYWEAGYAEGLGKPVIYTCKKQKFEECKTHFDTNHHLTIRWDCAKPQDAATELKATIRATLPEGAKMPVDENN